MTSLYTAVYRYHGIFRQDINLGHVLIQRTPKLTNRGLVGCAYRTACLVFFCKVYKRELRTRTSAVSFVGI